MDFYEIELRANRLRTEFPELSESALRALATNEWRASHGAPDTHELTPTSEVQADVTDRIVNLPNGGQRREVKLGHAKLVDLESEDRQDV